MKESSVKIPSSSSTDQLNRELSALLDEMLTIKSAVLQDAEKRLEKFLPYFKEQTANISAKNLARYLSLRQNDLRPLQQRLNQVGLSSLGRSEANVLTSINRILQLLARTISNPEVLTALNNAEDEIVSPHDMPLLDNSAQLFGTHPAHRKTYIMVTLPSEAAWNYSLVESLLAKGMNCVRINCAHDDAEHWQAMVNNVRQAEQKLNLSCKILIDLAGQKIRTGTIEHGPAIKRFKVNRNVYGRLTGPTDILLEEENYASESNKISNRYKYRLTLPRALHTQLAIGDRLRLSDIRGKKRDIYIVGQRSAKQWLAQCTQSIYISAETELTWQRKNKKDKFQTLGDFKPSSFQGDAEEIRLYEGDPLFLSATPEAGEAARFDGNGIIAAPAHISCSPPEVLSGLKIGEPVWIDDGKLGGVVESVSDDGALLLITHSRPKGVRLKAHKSINFPESSLQLNPLTDKDLHDLDFVCQHADMVGFSFVENAEHMNLLIAELENRNAAQLPIIAKIETNQAVKNLPDIIFATIGRHPLGIMIARGDLAVELGGERLAEIQEEILWLCEAAHVPVIWATQVLETLAKTGVMSRPEYTDAAMAERAECIMLNKGMYIEQALQTLDNIVMRMGAHQYKKRSYLRALQW
ncbi:pyruvate kinase [Kaarinaea lacus]